MVFSCLCSLSWCDVSHVLCINCHRRQMDGGHHWCPSIFPKCNNVAWLLPEMFGPIAAPNIGMQLTPGVALTKPFAMMRRPHSVDGCVCFCCWKCVCVRFSEHTPRVSEYTYQLYIDVFMCACVWCNWVRVYAIARTAYICCEPRPIAWCIHSVCMRVLRTSALALTMSLTSWLFECRPSCVPAHICTGYTPHTNQSHLQTQINRIGCRHNMRSYACLAGRT